VKINYYQCACCSYPPAETRCLVNPTSDAFLLWHGLRACGERNELIFFFPSFFFSSSTTYSRRLRGFLSIIEPLFFVLFLCPRPSQIPLFYFYYTVSAAQPLVSTAILYPPNLPKGLRRLDSTERMIGIGGAPCITVVLLLVLSLLCRNRVGAGNFWPPWSP
jgi:hypothetical protein